MAASCTFEGTRNPQVPLPSASPSAYAQALVPPKRWRICPRGSPAQPVSADAAGEGTVSLSASHPGGQPMSCYRSAPRATIPRPSALISTQGCISHGTLNLPLRVEARASGVVPLAQSGRAPSPLPPPLCTREPRSRALDPDYLLAQGTGRLNELHLAAKVGWCSGG